MAWSIEQSGENASSRAGSGGFTFGDVSSGGAQTKTQTLIIYSALAVGAMLVFRLLKRGR